MGDTRAIMERNDAFALAEESVQTILRQD